MKRILRSIIETIAIGGLNVGVLMYTIYLFMILLYALFNIKPFHLTSSGIFGITEFEKGVPVPVKFNEELPDSSFICRLRKVPVPIIFIIQTWIDLINTF